jgi:hypothetical protein
MSLSEKFRHQRKKEGSRARSQIHRHDGHKMASVVNHMHRERAELLDADEEASRTSLGRLARVKALGTLRAFILHRKTPDFSPVM